MKYNGVLPSQQIHEMLEGGFIEGMTKKNICTDTYDPVTTDLLYRLPKAFLPRSGEHVQDYIDRHGIRIQHNSVLEKGSCYIYRLREKVNKVIPDGIFGYSNPKSNIGRVDILTRILADGVARYDYIPPGYTGSLWAMLEPSSFSVIAGEGMSFNQIRFLGQSTRLDEARLGFIFDKSKLLYDHRGRQILYESVEHSDNDGSILLTLGFDFTHVGFEAIENGEAIDLSLTGHYEPREFFREITPANDSIHFGRNSFNILSSDESVRVPEDLACEMRPMDERSGEFRTHYAGYIAPGWGLGKDGQDKGRPLTLEARFYSGFTVRKGQPFAKIRFERMKEVPEVHYDQQPGTKFKVQDGPGLAKYFKQW